MKHTKQYWIKNETERNLVWVALVVSVLIIAAGIWYITHSFTGSFHSRTFKGLFKNFGALARITLFFVIAHYLIVFILQKHYIDRWASIKKILIGLSRFTRSWHTPVAIVTFSLILVHAIGAILYGIKPDFSNITGLLAMSALIPVPIAGMLRYRRKDRQWHLKSSIVFFILFLIHAFL